MIGTTILFERQKAIVTGLQTDPSETFVFIRYANGVKHILDLPTAEQLCKTPTRMVLLEKTMKCLP